MFARLVGFVVGGLAAVSACGDVKGAAGDAPTESACNDTQTDPSNCGSCGHRCSADFTCTMGHCGNEVAEVVGSEQHSCVVLHGGAVYCWGGNALGQLGDGGIAGTEVCGTHGPCRPAPAAVSGLTDVLHVSAAADHSCAVKRDGSVWCWGVNTDLELGHATSADMSCMNFATGITLPCNPVPARVALPGGVEATAVAVGRRYSCALSKTGDVYCWGDNTWGELGVALSTTGTSTPQKVGSSSTPFPAAVTQITTDHDDFPHVCALSDGQIWCWGSNATGGNGHDPATDPACGATICNVTPQVIKTAQGGRFDGIASIGIGRGFGCAHRTDGTVWCWGGDANWGSRGQGTDNDTNPAPVQVTIPQSNAAALYVGGGNAVFVVDTSGATWAWGRNNYGLLGNGRVTGVESTPKPTGFVGASQISPGQGNTLALKPDGTVWVWGDNTNAELGHTPATAGDQPAIGGQCNPQPAQLHGLP